jgi:parallel beta-helix repeat protein
MSKKIELTGISICLILILVLIVTSLLLGSVIALINNITISCPKSDLSANEKVTALQADQEVKFNGTAIEYFSSTGTCSWNVRVEKIVSGPSELQGHTVTVALWTGGSGEFPSGHMDPEIEPGDKVGVYGLYVGDDYVTLSGSEKYYINVIAAGNPTANFGYAPPAIFANQKVTFDASTSYDPDGAITKYDWDFGDGTKGSGVIITHSYTAQGKYNVVLTVTDDDSLTNSKSNEITVEETENAIYVPDDYSTIQQAVDAAKSGETIIVRAGSYTENVVVNKPHLTVRSENGAGATIVQAAKTNDKAFEVTADYVSVRGFTFKGANYTEKAGIYLTNANYCNVSDNTAYANYVGIYLWKSNNNTVIKNTLCTNDNAGLRSYHSSGNVITRNNVSRNYWNGIVIDGAYNTLSDNVASSNSYSGILVSTGSNNIICNNDIRSNKYYGICFSPLWDSCDNIIYLNSFVDNSANFYSNNVTNIWSSLSKITYTYNGNTYTSHLGNYWDD